MSISDQYQNVQNLIHKKLNELSRDHSEIDLIAVSKRQSEAKILELLNSGHRSFGENQLQEVETKWPQLKAQFPDLKLSFIGSIQSRKIKKICETCDSIHSIDREKVVKSISELNSEGKKIPELFLQVNIGLEPQKSGIHPNDVHDFLKMANTTYNITFAGLMCLPPDGEDPRTFFNLLKSLASENNITKLSMGMSSDYLTALECGATHIRVGSSIFGERS